MQRHDKDGYPYYCRICGNAYRWNLYDRPEWNNELLEKDCTGGTNCKFWPDVSECMLESEEDAKDRQVKVMSLNDWKIK